LASTQQSGEQHLVQGCGLFGIHPRQGRLGGVLHAEMVKPFALRLHVIGDVPETFPARQLPDQHGQELTPAVIGAEFLPRMMYFGKSIELMSR
jgi:hypothetical protein